MFAGHWPQQAISSKHLVRGKLQQETHTQSWYAHYLLQVNLKGCLCVQFKNTFLISHSAFLQGRKVMTY